MDNKDHRLYDKERLTKPGVSLTDMFKHNSFLALIGIRVAILPHNTIHNTKMSPRLFDPGFNPNLIYPPTLQVRPDGQEHEPTDTFVGWKTNPDRATCKLEDNAKRLALVHPPLFEDDVLATFSRERINGYASNLTFVDFAHQPDLDDVGKYVSAFFGLEVDVLELQMSLGNAIKLDDDNWTLTLYATDGGNKNEIGDINFNRRRRIQFGADVWSLSAHDLQYLIKKIRPSGYHAFCQLTRSTIYTAELKPVKGVCWWEDGFCLVSLSAAYPLIYESVDLTNPAIRYDDTNHHWRK